MSVSRSQVSDQVLVDRRFKTNNKGIGFTLEYHECEQSASVVVWFRAVVLEFHDVEFHDV